MARLWRKSSSAVVLFMDKEQMKSEITKLIEKYNREKGKRYNED